MDIKVRDLRQTETIENENKLMVLVDDDLNLVKNITKEEFLTNIISSTENNALVQETDGNLYVNTSEIADDLAALSDEVDTIETNIGDLSDLTTEDKTNLVAAINEAASSGGGGRNVGEIISSTLPLTDAGLHLLDGSLILGGGIYQGFVDYIADLYNDTKVYNPSAFTVVGSPTITADGIASGFSGSNGNPSAAIQVTYSLNSNNKVIIKGTQKALNLNTSNPQTIWSMGYGSNTRLEVFSQGLAFREGNTQRVWMSASSILGRSFIDGDIIDSTVELNGNTVTVTIKCNNSTVTSSYTGMTAWSTNFLSLGFRYSDLFSWQGSIDLKQFSMTVDGVEVFSGSNPANYFTTESAWQTSVTTYGVCGKFVYDSVNNTVRLPKVTGIIEGTTDVSALGDLVEAGLPNITGYIKSFENAFSNASGAFTLSGWNGSANYHNNGTINMIANIDFDASRSSSLYKNNFNTVQPQTIKAFYYIVIANSAKTEIQVDIDEVATDLNGKADVDLSNINASQSAKNEIIGWGMPDFSSRITIPYNTSIQLPCDAAVYHSNYSATYTDYCHTAISLDNSTWIDIGYWGYTAMAFSYTVLPKGIYVKCYGGKDTATYTAWYAPLKGTSINNTSNSGTSEGGTSSNPNPQEDQEDIWG